MRKATLSLAVLFAVVLSSQAAVVSKTASPFDFTYFVPCTNAGQGELVHFTGFFEITVTKTFENGWLLLTEHVQPVITALGETTGVTYKVSGSQESTFKFSPIGTSSATDANNFSVTGDGVTYHLHAVLKYTDNGNNIQIDDFFAFCN